ncbi:hypothetical protein UE98_19355 [Burkholderia cenocepacia]|nr:hypothetical protein UE98_19355 [Burkholderia cenocepacia]
MMFLINKIDRFNCFGGLEDEISSQYNINKKQIENIFDAFIQKGFIKKKDASSKVQYMFNPEFAHKCDYMDDYYKLKSQYDNA